MSDIRPGDYIHVDGLGMAQVTSVESSTTITLRWSWWQRAWGWARYRLSRLYWRAWGRWNQQLAWVAFFDRPLTPEVRAAFWASGGTPVPWWVLAVWWMRRKLRRSP